MEGCFSTRMVRILDWADLSIWASSSASVMRPFLREVGVGVVEEDFLDLDFVFVATDPGWFWFSLIGWIRLVVWL